MTIGISGPRELTEKHHLLVREDLEEILKREDTIYVGDAKGVDELAANYANSQGKNVYVFNKRNNIPGKARGAERSTRMVKSMAGVGAVLHAWPNKACPPNLKPEKNWPKNVEGSGTWGTIALAVGLGLRVEVHPLEVIELPDWITEQIHQFSFLDT